MGKDVCRMCGKLRIVNARDSSGPICAPCYGQMRAESCNVCGLLRPVARRQPDGSSLCSACVRKLNPEPCSVCGRSRPVASRPNGSPLCANCRIMTNSALMFKNYVKGAHRRGLDFNLDEKEFDRIVRRPCHYCGQPIGKHLNGIDRIDNAIGYMVTNCVSCCAICNRMKGAMPKEDFLVKVRNIVENMDRDNGQL
jgi:hypothetical protein